MKKRKYTKADIEEFKKSPKCPIHLFGGKDEEFIRFMQSIDWKPSNAKQEKLPLSKIETEPIAIINTHWVLIDGIVDIYECAVCGYQVSVNRHGILPDKCAYCGRTVIDTKP